MKSKMEGIKAGPHQTQLGATETQTLVQVHLAEYQALTTRNTYSILIQSSFWGMIVFYVTLIVAAWPKDKTYHPLFVWGSGIFLQFFALAFGSFSQEQYNNVRYLEQKLRPRLAALLSSDSFWGYEQYLSAQRGDRTQWWEYLLPIGAGVVLFIAAAFRYWELDLLRVPLTIRLVQWDLIGIVPNLILLVMVFSVTHGLIATRKEMVSKAHRLSRNDSGK